VQTITCIRNRLASAVSRSCSEKSCECRLDGLTNFVVVKGEKVGQGLKICDCIIFVGGNPVIVGLVELKGKVAHASEIQEKLSNGTIRALEILEACSAKTPNFRLLHVVLCKRWHPSEYRIVTRKRVEARGSTYSILPKGCGTSFRAIMSDFL